jgi:hypothetical protein
MTLPADIHRCRGIGTSEGAPDGECLECERRTAGIADYMAGRRDVLWMAPIADKPCPQKLGESK